MKFKASGRLALIIAAGIWISCSGPLHAQDATAQAAPGAAQQPSQPNPLQALFGAKPAAPAPAEQAAVEPGKPIALTRYTKRHSRHHHRRRYTARSHRHTHVAKDSVKDSVKSSKTRDDADESKVSQDKAPQDQPAQDKPAQAQAAAPTSPDSANATAMSATVANARAQLIDHNATAGAPATMTPAPTTDAAQTGSPPSDTAVTAQSASAGTDAAAAVVPADQVNEVDRAMNATRETNATKEPTLAMAAMNPQGKAAAETTAVASNDDSTWAQTSMIGKVFIAFGGLLMLASAARMFMA
jgi:hypothetical protein